MPNVPGEGMDCRAVKVKDVVRVPAVSPTTHVFVPPDVALQSAFVRPVPDVSVTVTVDHGLHDAVSVIVTVWPMVREIEAGLDVTVHLLTIINDSVGGVTICVGVKATAVGVLSTVFPVTEMSLKMAPPKFHEDEPPNVVDVRE